MLRTSTISWYKFITFFIHYICWTSEGPNDPWIHAIFLHSFSLWFFPIIFSIFHKIGCRPNSRSSCGGIDCIGFSCTLSQTLAMFSAIWRSFDIRVLYFYVLIPYQIDCLEFGHRRVDFEEAPSRNASNVQTNEHSFW